MEQLIIVLLFGLIAVIQWVFKKSVELRRQNRERRRGLEAENDILRRETPPPQSQAASDDEALRRLREALGLPDEAPQPVIPARRVLQPPPLPPAAVSKKRAAAIEKTPVPNAAPLHEWTKKAGSTASRPKSRVRELLSSPGGLQDAVILSEILGSPRGTKI